MMEIHNLPIPDLRIGRTFWFWEAGGIPDEFGGGKLAIEEAPVNREQGLDSTLADTFPCSDALSSIPDPDCPDGGPAVSRFSQKETNSTFKWLS